MIHIVYMDIQYLCIWTYNIYITNEKEKETTENKTRNKNKKFLLFAPFKKQN